MSKVGDEIRLCGDALADMQVREEGRRREIIYINKIMFC
jgi:hypothetical protein